MGLGCPTRTFFPRYYWRFPGDQFRFLLVWEVETGLPSLRSHSRNRFPQDQGDEIRGVFFFRSTLVKRGSSRGILSVGVGVLCPRGMGRVDLEYRF